MHITFFFLVGIGALEIPKYTGNEFESSFPSSLILAKTSQYARSLHACPAAKSKIDSKSCLHDALRFRVGQPGLPLLHDFSDTSTAGLGLRFRTMPGPPPLHDFSDRGTPYFLASLACLRSMISVTAARIVLRTSLSGSLARVSSICICLYRGFRISHMFCRALHEHAKFVAGYSCRSWHRKR